MPQESMGARGSNLHVSQTAKGTPSASMHMKSGGGSMTAPKPMMPVKNMAEDLGGSPIRSDQNRVQRVASSHGNSNGSNRAPGSLPSPSNNGGVPTGKNIGAEGTA